MTSCGQADAVSIGATLSLSLRFCSAKSRGKRNVSIPSTPRCGCAKLHMHATQSLREAAAWKKKKKIELFEFWIIMYIILLFLYALKCRYTIFAKSIYIFYNLKLNFLVIEARQKGDVKIRSVRSVVLKLQFISWSIK